MVERVADRVVVVGSVNEDTTVGVARFPAPGETVLGDTLTRTTGGKGANQAAAAARRGATVTFIGAVGDDDAAGRVEADLDAAGVRDLHLQRFPGTPTGVALITLDASGENSIVVVSGANAALLPDAALDALDAGTRPTVVVLPGEVPVEVIDRVAVWCHARGVRLLLNLAPVVAVDPRSIATADPLVVNEHEARDLLDATVDADVEELARALARRARSVLLTLGADGALCAWGDTLTRITAPKVTAVDTTGAGDAFVGVAAAELALGTDLVAAARAATEAAAATVTRRGGMPSYDVLEPVAQRQG